MKATPIKSSSSRGIVALILFNIFFLSRAQSPGFFLDDWQPKTAEIPAHEFIGKTGNKPTVNISVDLSRKLQKIPKYIYGNNAVTWDNGLRSNTTAMTDLQNLSPNVLRWPGGNLSNRYFWNLPSGNPPTDIPPDMGVWYGMDTDSWQMSVDEYYDLLIQSNSTGIICVNYSYARYGTGPDPVATAAHMAAEWVRYDNGRTKFWEIGNENYGNWQTGYEIDTALNQDGQPRFISGQLYGQHCKVFLDSMRAAAGEIGSEIKVGINVYDSELSHNQIFEDWNEGVMPEVGGLVDFLAVHSYFTPYNEDSPVSTILNAHHVPGEIFDALEADMTEAGKEMIPVAMTEWNIFAVGSWQQVSYINGMLAAITLGEYVLEDYGMANRWDLVNGWNNGNDHAMFSTGGEPGVDPYNPRAVFFYMYYHQKYFGDRMLETSVSGNNSVVAHASEFSSGETGLMIANKSNVSQTAEIDLFNGSFGLNYYYHTLTGGTDNGDFSRKVLINGIETDEQGGGPDEYESIKARASERGGAIKVELPPRSVVYMMIEKTPPLSYVYSAVDTSTKIIRVELSEAVQPIADPSGISVLINGSTIPVIDRVEVDAAQPNIIHIFLQEDLRADDKLTLSYSGSSIKSLDGTSLLPFSNEAVENLIPGGPYNLRIITRTSDGQEPLEGCLVSIQGESKSTDGSGEVIFVKYEGTYTISVEKTHYNTVELAHTSIQSDTTLYVDLEPRAYAVTLHVMDDHTGGDISDVRISVNELSAETGPGGFAIFYLTTGIYQISLMRFNYHPAEMELSVTSDTTLDIHLLASHGKLIFKLKDGMQFVKNALVKVGSDSLLSNNYGVCIFESVLIGTPLSYSIKHDHYYEMGGDLDLQSDTTIDLQLEKSVANIKFTVETISGPVENGSVILNQDTAWCNAQGMANFFYKPKGQQYQYQVNGDFYEAQTGMINLVTDTSIIVTLSRTIETGQIKALEPSIYPNPAKDHLLVDMKENRAEFVRMADLTGKTVLVQNYPVPQSALALHLNFEPGIYLIYIRTETSEYRTKILIR